jgi:histone-lysine N-methyltransferase SETMAR
VSEKFFVENQIVHAPHPPYRPDLAPSDFWLFGHMNASLAGQSFAKPEGLFEGIMAFLEEAQVFELKLVFHHWVERTRRVLDHNGDYYNE